MPAQLSPMERSDPVGTEEPEEKAGGTRKNLSRLSVDRQVSQSWDSWPGRPHCLLGGSDPSLRWPGPDTD